MKLECPSISCQLKELIIDWVLQQQTLSLYLQWGFIDISSAYETIMSELWKNSSSKPVSWRGSFNPKASMNIEALDKS